MNILKIETNFKRKLFFSETKIKPKNYSDKLENQIITIYPNIKYQIFLGFGGAFTESSGYAYSKLSEENKKRFIEDYFKSSALNYNLCRIPIGSSDFSLKSYSYSNTPELSDFSIEQDKKYIIPLIKKAQEKNPNLKFLASPWSPPKFMKSNKMLIIGGKLLDKYKQTYANYLVRFIQEYKKQGIEINYITVQNEPNAVQAWESCLYSAEKEKEFVIKYLFPTFKQNHINTKILIWDHNKEKLYLRACQELNTNQALEAISGIAFHWYTGDHFENIKLTSETFPGKLLIHTEGCTGYSKFNTNDEVKNAEMYAHDIIGDLNSGTNGYIDWNLILDHKGGPNHKLNYCNSPIMLDFSETNYIKNLTFYYIGHFSKIIKPNSKRIAHSSYSTNIEVTAFKNQDNSISVILLNRNNFNLEYNLLINNTIIHDNLDSHAIVSYIF